MMKKNLFNQLQLSYSPLCNRDFTVLRDDVDIQHAIEKSSIYAIVQRPVLRFDNFRPNSEDYTFDFEIRQEKNPNVLKCRMPMFQEALGTSDPLRGIDLSVGSNAAEHEALRNGAFPLSNFHGFKIIDVDPDDDSKRRFLRWFTPEKFLQNAWNDLMVYNIVGDIRSFTKYNVHYVGKATEQEIWQRLTGHSKLQDVLSMEDPFCYGTLPTHEIAILAFTFKENILMREFGETCSDDELLDYFLDNELPSQKTIYLDAEKALIHSMQPAYNSELFKNYPKSKDGLYDHKFGVINYTFVDPITLVYERGEIRGGLMPLGGDAIRVINNDTVEFVKFNGARI